MSLGAPCEGSAIFLSLVSGHLRGLPGFDLAWQSKHLFVRGGFRLESLASFPFIRGIDCCADGALATVPHHYAGLHSSNARHSYRMPAGRSSLARCAHTDNSRRFVWLCSRHPSRPQHSDDGQLNQIAQKR